MNATPSMQELAPGTSFGRYTILRRIGVGGMAVVYEARHVDLHKRVALKVLSPLHALRMGLVQRFVLEARAACRIAHPNVVGISDIGTVDGATFLAMDLLEGELLSSVIDREGALPVSRLADIMLPVISAVAAAHAAGILHRDLKPDNIFLSRRLPHGEHPVLLDFGISKVDLGMGNDDETPITAVGEVLGTPPYMAPEQIAGGMVAFDERSDQYALGVTLYEAATGSLPFEAVGEVRAILAVIEKGGALPPSVRRAGIPQGFDAVVARAMNLDPAARYPSLSSFGRALLPFVSPLVRSLWEPELIDPTPLSVRLPPPPLRAGDLGALPVFASLPEAELVALLALAPPACVAAGATLFDQGTRTASAIVVVSGEIELFRTQGADTWGVGIVCDGGVLGLSALWGEGRRAVSAIAKTECVVVEIRRALLDHLGADCPRVSFRLHERAAMAIRRRLRSARHRLDALLSRPNAAPSREALARLAAAVGELALPLPGENAVR